MSQPDPLEESEPPKSINKRFVAISLVSALTVALLVAVAWSFWGSTTDKDGGPEANTTQKQTEPGKNKSINPDVKLKSNEVKQLTANVDFNISSLNEFFDHSAEGAPVEIFSPNGKSTALLIKKLEVMDCNSDEDCEMGFKEVSGNEKEVNSSENNLGNPVVNNEPPVPNSEPPVKVKSAEEILSDKAYTCILDLEKCALSSKEVSEVKWEPVLALWNERNADVASTLDISNKKDLLQIVWKQDDSRPNRTDILEMSLHDLSNKGNGEIASKVIKAIFYSGPEKRDPKYLLDAAINKGHILTALKLLQTGAEAVRKMSFTVDDMPKALSSLLKGPFVKIEHIDSLKKYLEIPNPLIATTLARLNRLEFFMEYIMKMPLVDLMAALEALLASEISHEMKPFLEALATRLNNLRYAAFIKLIDAKKELLKDNPEDVAFLESLISAEFKLDLETKAAKELEIASNAVNSGIPDSPPVSGSSTANPSSVDIDPLKIVNPDPLPGAVTNGILDPAISSIDPNVNSGEINDPSLITTPPNITDDPDNSPAANGSVDVTASISSKPSTKGPYSDLSMSNSLRTKQNVMMRMAQKPEARILKCLVNCSDCGLTVEEAKNIKWSDYLEIWLSKYRIEKSKLENSSDLRELLETKVDGDDWRTGLIEIMLHVGMDHPKVVKKALFQLSLETKTALRKSALERGHYLTFQALTSKESIDKVNFDEHTINFLKVPFMTYEDLSNMKKLYGIGLKESMVLLAKASRMDLFTQSIREYVNELNFLSIFEALIQTWAVDKGVEPYVGLLVEKSKNKRLKDTIKHCLDLKADPGTSFGDAQKADYEKLIQSLYSQIND